MVTFSKIHSPNQIEISPVSKINVKEFQARSSYKKMRKLNLFPFSAP